MKKLTLLFVLVHMTVFGREDGQNIKVPECKNEISVLGGKALNLEDFKLVNTPYYTYFFSSVCFYRNFNRMQLGIGVEVEPIREKQTKDYQLSYFAPHLQLNRTFELQDFSLYAGVMGGYAKDNSQHYLGGLFPISMETKGGGFVGGIQAGALFKLTRFIAINAELAGRAREINYTTVMTMTGNLSGTGQRETLVKTSNYGRSGFYLPFKLGIRVRF